MATWTLRARETVAGNVAVVVACFLVLAAVGGGLAYTAYVEPGAHTEERAGASWETTAEFGHAATVREPNSVFPVGTTLENRSAYFGTVAPVLDGNFTYGYTASEGGSLSIGTDADIVLRSVERNQTGAVRTRHWQRTRDAGEMTESGVEPGESVRVPFSFDARALANETERIESDLGASLGETEALVRVTVSLSGTVNGESVERTERYVLPVGLGTAYTVEDPGVVTDPHTSTRTVTVTNQYGPIRRIGGPLLLFSGLGGAVGLLWARRSGRLSTLTEAERERLAFDEARSEFDEWIHPIRLPPSTFDRPRAEAESLSALVDFAIDTNSSVVEDPDDGTYYVVHGEHLYSYSPPTDAPVGQSADATAFTYDGELEDGGDGDAADGRSGPDAGDAPTGE
ncbi:hypothetical protein SAMN04488063_3531 [Halopelagius inordinatus]|uniref:DUF5305 domain-containing protein n=1 Tax=Halopelagius inordinatus TaxID=553467 RepID=A0A1I2WF43_9EURY|nr:DUF5305 domain-containing protein [Halopelagius inordinatus]SFG99898.1 hypothetical protein SAMN04488063_3531 [Halopelagius inordinatus]